MGNDGNRCCSPSEALECLFSMGNMALHRMHVLYHSNCATDVVSVRHGGICIKYNIMASKLVVQTWDLKSTSEIDNNSNRKLLYVYQCQFVT